MQATIDPEQLRAFVAVVRAESFTRAAEALATRKSHLSRLVVRLERRLDAQLLRRTTRSVTVTELGREVFDRAVTILAALEETERLAESAKGVPQGVLKLTCGEEFGLTVVSKWIAGYLSAFPRVRVEADYSNRLVDIVREGFDLAIRVGASGEADLTASKLGEVRYGLFASPAYLTSRGVPSRPRDLDEHDTVVFGVPSDAEGPRLRGLCEEELLEDDRARLTQSSPHARENSRTEGGVTRRATREHRSFASPGEGQRGKTVRARRGHRAASGYSTGSSGYSSAERNCVTSLNNCRRDWG